MQKQYCFGYDINRGKCRILYVTECTCEQCSFYKTERELMIEG